MADQASKVHVAINCCDLSKSIDFYRNLFGLEPSKVRIGYAKFDVTNPPLNQHPFTDAGRAIAPGHTGRFDRGCVCNSGAMAPRGLVTRDEMQTNCCFATQDKTSVLDPDGNEGGIRCVEGRSAREEEVREWYCVPKLFDD